MPQSSDKASSKEADSGGSERLQERFARAPAQQSFALDTEQKIAVKVEESRNQMATAARRAAPPPAPAVEVPVDSTPLRAIRQTTSMAPPPPAPSVAPEAAAESGRAADSKRNDESVQDIVATARRREQTNGTAGAGPRGTIPHSNAQKEAESDSDKIGETAPAAWLEHIRELRRAGRRSDADREWERFVKQYPDYVVDAADTARPPKK